MGDEADRIIEDGLMPDDDGPERPMECEACGGSGGEIRPEQGCAGKESRGKGREHFHTCPRCKGTGIEPRGSDHA